MNKNLIIFLGLIIIFIMIFISFIFNKNFIQRKKESFFPFDFKENCKNIPNFVSDYENIKETNDPNYTKENITQYNFDRIFKKIERINKEKINLKNHTNYNFYTQSTTDDKLRMDLDNISKYVVLILNNDNYYDFNKTNYGDVEVWVDKNGNEEIKYELFLWDKKNYFEIKLWVNVVKFVEKEEMMHYGIRDTHYIFPDFNIGYPFKDQIIPLPTDTIITARMDTSTASIRPNTPAKIKHLYLNQIEVQNSTLIVDYHKNKYPGKKLDVTEDGFSGITDSSLEYIKIKGNSTPYLENGRKYNQWPTLDEEPKWKGQYPSKPPPRHWDDDGVYYYGKKNSSEIAYKGDDKLPYSDKRLCDVYNAGTRWSDDKEPLQPYYWPTLATIPRNCGENFWLFDNSAGPVGGNTFIGGGKR